MKILKLKAGHKYVLGKPESLILVSKYGFDISGIINTSIVYDLSGRQGIVFINREELRNSRHTFEVLALRKPKDD